MARCRFCGKNSPLTAASLGVCRSCLRSEPAGLSDHLDRVHETARRPFGLPPHPPNDPQGLPCRRCANRCRIPEGAVGYCGLRVNKGNRLVGGKTSLGRVHWYLDPLPTNCVADWVCPAGTGAGYPEWAHLPGPERGYANLAVFYRGCSFDCLGCQNWQCREICDTETGLSPRALAAQASGRVACICFFGGDPSPQIPHSLAVAAAARKRQGGRILRICWETNGTMHPRWLERAMRTALESGGCIKFDLKAWDERIHVALAGRSNRQTLANFRRAAELAGTRQEPPALVASTLLVPGYVDVAEVSKIAAFIAGLDRDIPYALLGFHPQFYLHDLPVTSRAHAEAAVAAAKTAGLRRVHIGNRQLLGSEYGVEDMVGNGQT